MVLIDADAIEPEVGGELEQVEVVVIDGVTLHGVIEAGININPHAAMRLPEVLRQVWVRHEIEPVELHLIPRTAVPSKLIGEGSRSEVL